MSVHQFEILICAFQPTQILHKFLEMELVRASLYLLAVSPYYVNWRKLISESISAKIKRVETFFGAIL